MRRKVFAGTVLLSLVLSLNAFSQSNNANVGGTVQDASGAFIPGVMITATNNRTGIVTTVLTNEAGAYQFASLQPGAYEFKAELPGFQTAVAKDFQLGGAQQARVNFTLQVSAVAGTSIDVSVAADTLLATSSNSVGAVLPEYKVRDLPLASRDVFGLVADTAGVQSQNGLISNFAGGRISQVNTMRDGINVSAGRFEDGAWSLTYTSPDLVEEVKVVVAPVDAQTARGSGQVSMVTRSGTNQIRGSAWWVNHNSALDASSWFNNFNGVAKDYDNRNQYGARVGGPIVKNKTFFFLLFEGQRDLKRQQATGNTLTDMARQGIFRYFPGFDNVNASGQNPVVDRNGNPVTPTGATPGSLSAVDLFGNCTFNGAPVANCKTFRDPQRPAISSTAYMQETLKRMPSPNLFTAGDGLNTAQINFTRRVDGQDLTLGNGPDVKRDQYNARIDQNFNSTNKLSLIATREHTWGGSAQSGQRSWPQGFDGEAVKRPDVYIITFTSTLSPSLLNELRLGRRRSIDLQYGPANRPDSVGAQVLPFVPTASGIPFRAIPTDWTSFATYGGFGVWRGHVSPLYSIGDDLSWTHGKHAFKGGYEFRNTISKGFGDPGFTPIVTFGAGNNPVNNLDGAAANYPGLSANAAGAARTLLTDLSGSIDHINQSFGIMSAQNTVLQGTPTIPVKYYRQHQREMSAFFKDDWKFRPDLTLNLGVHWEYYGQPFEENGLDARVIGNDESALTGVTCTSSPGTIGFTSACSNLTQVQFIGRNSTRPGINANLKGNDFKQFGPAVGFAWNVPWFRKGKTVLRSGYGISYTGALRNFITVDSTVGTVPGINVVGSGGTGYQYNPATYTSLSNISLPISLPPEQAKSAPFLVPTTDRTQGISVYNRTPAYTQNWNLEIQREVARNTTIEIRYVGTKGSKLWGTINLNQIDALHHNPDLFNAFNAVRAGSESTLLNQMMMGGNFGGQVVNGTTWTGAMAVRTNSTTRGQLANGNVGAFLNALNTNLNFTGNTTTATGSILRKNGFPDNYLVVNPQYGSVSMLDNLSSSTYHSLQMQFTRRLSKGFTNTTAWTWSKALGDADSDAGANYRDLTRRSIEKGLLGFDHSYQITSNGTYELPFGTNHFLLGSAPGWAQNLVSKWQIGGIMNYNTGAPLSLTSGIQALSTNGSQPDVAGPLPKNLGQVTKVSNGVVFFNGYTQVPDPYSTSVSTLNGLSTAYSNKAIQAPNGQIVLVNPQPGEVGTLGLATLKGPGSLNLDMNLVKRFKVHENTEFEFRLDAISVLNHPNFGAPVTSINGAGNTFGRITSATGSRSFIVNTRVNF